MTDFPSGIDSSKISRSDLRVVRMIVSPEEIKFRTDLLLALHIIAAAVTLLAGVGIGIMLSILSRG